MLRSPEFEVALADIPIGVQFVRHIRQLPPRRNTIRPQNTESGQFLNRSEQRAQRKWPNDDSSTSSANSCSFAGLLFCLEN